MPVSTIDITTSAGTCATEIVTPAGVGPWPAVILLHDAGGPRQAMTEMATRIAGPGYIVAIPDLFHRAGSVINLFPAGAVPSGDRQEIATKIFEDPALKEQFFARYYGPALAYENLHATLGPLLDHLVGRDDFRGGVGTTGYCMGGNASLRAATLFGARIAATASIHGGFLAAPTPESPHLRANSIESRVYVAGASNDESFTDEMKQSLIDALASAHVPHTVETYPAEHGFAVPDASAYDAAAAERHYEALDAFFGATLAR